MTKSIKGKAGNSMTVEAAARFYKAEATKGNGRVAKGSPAARVMSAAMHNEQSAGMDVSAKRRRT